METAACKLFYWNIFVNLIRVSELAISIGNHFFALNRPVPALTWKCHQRHLLMAMLLTKTNGYLHCANLWQERRRKTRWTGSTHPTSTRKWKCSRLALLTRERLLKYSAFITLYILNFNKTTNFNITHTVASSARRFSDSQHAHQDWRSQSVCSS